MSFKVIFSTESGERSEKTATTEEEALAAAKQFLAEVPYLNPGDTITVTEPDD
jgi:hypothetical protein